MSCLVTIVISLRGLFGVVLALLCRHTHVKEVTLASHTAVKVFETDAFSSTQLVVSPRSGQPCRALDRSEYQDSS